MKSTPGPRGGTKATLEAIERFNEAFGRHDVDEVMKAMTDDCVFENTCPPPDGGRYVGKERVRGFWERVFRSSPSAIFETEEIFAAGDRCVPPGTGAWCGGSTAGWTRAGSRGASGVWTYSASGGARWPRSSPT